MSVAPGKQVVCEGDVCRIVDSKGADAKAAPEGVSTGSSAITALLGQTLLSQGAPISTNSVSGTGKYLGLYFSAHWCPPCRGFTPRLAKFYENFKKSHAEASNFDVVFVSSDRSADDFASYYAEMPWKALPYEDRETKQKLSAKFKVSGIPTFIILDADTGAVIASDGRSKVESDPEGAEFPWRPPSLASLLEGPAVNAKGESKAISELVKDKITAIYFSAHWCPPCRQFTPMLAEFYKSLQATGTAFEVLFVSSDRSEEQFREYLGEMPWWALPYGDSKRRAALSSRFDVEGIPTLIILSEGAAKVITTEGTSCLRSDPDGADFPWAPKPVEKLTPTAIPRLNDGETCYILFTDDSSAAGVQRAEELLIDSALPEFTKEDPGAFFYVADAAAKLSRSVLGMLKLESAPLPALAMLALPKYAVAPAAGSAADVQGFVAACNAGSVALQSLESA